MYSKYLVKIIMHICEGHIPTGTWDTPSCTPPTPTPRAAIRFPSRLCATTVCSASNEPTVKCPKTANQNRISNTIITYYSLKFDMAYFVLAAVFLDTNVFVGAISFVNKIQAILFFLAGILLLHYRDNVSFDFYFDRVCTDVSPI